MRLGAWGVGVAVLGSVLALAGCGGDDTGEAAAGPTTSMTATTTTTVAPTTTVPPCPESGVEVSVGPVDGASGLRAMSLQLTNCGTEPYTIDGYPELQLLDEERQPFDVEVLHGAEPITTDGGFCTPSGRFDEGPQPVTLDPGEQAFAGVVWRNLTTDELDQLITAPHLSVAPTAGEAAQDLALEGGIDLGTTGRLGISAWHPPHTACS